MYCVGFDVRYEYGQEEKYIIDYDIYIYYIAYYMIEIRTLEILSVIAAERSVTRAAARLNVSQPALSASLRQIRNQFNDVLFVRAQGGLVPTERAETLIAGARTILDMTAELETAVQTFNPTTSEMEFFIAASDFSQFVLLPTLVHLLQSQAPNIILTFSPLNFDVLETDLDRGALDMAILPHGMAPKSMQIRKLFDEQFSWIANRDHWICQGRRRLSEVMSCQHVRVVPASSKSIADPKQTEQRLALAGESRKIALTVTNYHVVPDMIANSQMISLYPNAKLPDLPSSIRTVNTDDVSQPLTMSLIWHARTQATQAQMWLRNQIVRAAKTAYP